MMKHGDSDSTQLLASPKSCSKDLCTGVRRLLDSAACTAMDDPWSPTQFDVLSHEWESPESAAGETIMI